MSEPRYKGLYIGERHSQRGIPVDVDGVKPIEVEGLEYKICEQAYNSDSILKFENKTNLEVLDSIHDNFSCRFKQDEAQSGDFILCRLVVADKEPHNRKGTVRQILDVMQEEKSCRLSNGIIPDKAEQGGPLGIDKWNRAKLELPKNWFVRDSWEGNNGEPNYTIEDKTGTFGIVIEYFNLEKEYSIGFWELNDVYIVPMTKRYQVNMLAPEKVSEAVLKMAQFLEPYIDGSYKDKELKDGGALDSEKYYILSLNGRRIDKILGSEMTVPENENANILNFLALYGYNIKRVKQSEYEDFYPNVNSVDSKNLHRRAILYLRKGVKLIDMSPSERYFEELQTLGLSPDMIEKLFLKGLYIGKKGKYYFDREKTDETTGEIINIKSDEDLFIEIEATNGNDEHLSVLTETAFDDDDFYLDIYGTSEKKKKVVICRIKAKDSGRYLILKRAPNQSEPNMWHLLSGTVDAGDKNDRQTIVREVYEEIGYKGGFERIEFLDMVVSDKQITRYYDVELSSEFTCELNGENSESAWIKPIELAHYELLPVLSHYISNSQSFFKDGGKVASNMYDLRIPIGGGYPLIEIIRDLFRANDGVIDKLKLDRSIKHFTNPKIRDKFQKALEEYKELADLEIKDGNYIAPLLQHVLNSGQITEDFKEKYGVSVKDLADAYNKSVEERTHQDFTEKRLGSVYRNFTKKYIDPDSEEFDIFSAEFISAVGELGIKLKKPIDVPNVPIQTFPRTAKPLKESGLKSLANIVSDDESQRAALKGVYVDGDYLVGCNSLMLVRIKDTGYKKYNNQVLDVRTGKKLIIKDGRDVVPLEYPQFKSIIPENPFVTEAIDIDNVISMAYGAIMTFKNLDREINKFLFDFDDTLVAVNCNYLFDVMQTLKVNGAKKIVFEYADSNTGLIVKADSGDMGLIMPIMLGESIGTDPKRFELTNSLEVLKAKLKAIKAYKSYQEIYSENRLNGAKKRKEVYAERYHNDNLKSIAEKKKEYIDTIQAKIHEIENGGHKSEFNNMYFILVEDSTPPTHNINMHSFECMAKSKDEAIEKMHAQRPELKNRRVLTVKHDAFDNRGVILDYEDEQYKKDIESTLSKLKARELEKSIGKDSEEAARLIDQFNISLGIAKRKGDTAKVNKLETRIKFLSRVV